MSLEPFTTHYSLVKRYLDSFLIDQQRNNNGGGARTRAKDKLAKLSSGQFGELSTDVYDECVRRVGGDGDVPFLPFRSEFTEKRNQARQKLASLPSFRFKELAAEVLFELERRFPMIVERYKSRQPPSNGPPPSQPQQPLARNMTSTSDYRGQQQQQPRYPPDNRVMSPPQGYPQPIGRPPPQQSYRRPSQPTLTQMEPSAPPRISPYQPRPQQLPLQSIPPPTQQQYETRSIPVPLPSTTRTVPSRGASRNAEREMTGGEGGRPQRGDAMTVRSEGSLTRAMMSPPPPGVGAGGGKSRSEFGGSEYGDRGGSKANLSVPPPRNVSVTSSSFDDPRIRPLESQIASLRLELDARPLKEDYDRLEDDVLKLEKELEAEKKDAREWKKKYDELIEDYDAVREEVKVVGREKEDLQARLEASSSKEQAAAAEEEKLQLLEDVKLLTEKNQSLLEQRDRDADTMRGLKEEVQRLKADLANALKAESAARSRMDSAKGDLFSQSSAAPPSPSPTPSSSPLSKISTALSGRKFSQDASRSTTSNTKPPPITADPLFQSYKSAAAILLDTVRPDNNTESQPPTAVLGPLRNLIISVKAITESADTTVDSLYGSTAFEIGGTLSRAPHPTLRAVANARDTLTDRLTNLMNVSKEHANGGGRRRRKGVELMNAFEEGVEELESAVVDMLECIRRLNTEGGPARNNNMNGRRMDMGTDTSPPVTPLSPLDTRSFRINNTSPDPKHQQPYSPTTTATVTSPSNSGLMYTSTSAPSLARPTVSNTSAPLDPLSLKLYLEDQTDALVTHITSLLTQLRSASTHIPAAIPLITSTVTHITTQTTKSMDMIDEDVRPQAEILLTIMGSAVEGLERRAREADRQGCAEVSYEIAKHVKDLVALFE
ncbi:uncharacterized protein EV422DRAFT_621266 [Fimicolochytrium jonesii]|uniref:uncharacterized protein n=1 Tax=Fimicolochytrium jonesii TaxID=1396493 RepID=UPI0022FE82FC|nr:uncharacterized protein EV422DRAFT_621266 [Fimicolochytrium jonesii]KAI8819139.1 hypothetical protein EV422DRAFT_621266 [Fimicolochytrium jonesii]